MIDPAIAANSGRIVKLMGDGALVEFASAVDAVTCAIEIQRKLRDRDAGGSEADPIRLRIGINVGDIIIEGEDILGDGVNIAARIEGIAEPGGISISEDAWRQVQGKVAANFLDAGEQSLKNIARPVRVYRLELMTRCGQFPCDDAHQFGGYLGYLLLPSCPDSLGPIYRNRNTELSSVPDYCFYGSPQGQRGTIEIGGSTGQDFELLVILGRPGVMLIPTTVSARAWLGCVGLLCGWPL